MLLSHATMNKYETVITICYFMGISSCLGDGLNGCDGYYKESTGNITSPNYPSPYPDNADCTYVVGVESLKYVWVQFIDIQFENEFDYLEYGVGRSIADKQTVQQKIGGKTEAPFRFKVETDSGIWFHLITDSAVGYRGFSLTWIVEDYCGGTHTNNTGFLISPAHPGLYPSNLDCIYVIQLNNTSHIRITTQKLQLEADYDRITYGIGGNVESDAAQGYFTGQHESPLVWDVIASTVWLHFMSDYAVEFTGFNISWEASDLMQPTSTPTSSLEPGVNVSRSTNSSTISPKTDKCQLDNGLAAKRRQRQRKTDIVLKVVAGGAIGVIALIIIWAVCKPYCRRSHPDTPTVPRIVVDSGSRDSPSGISMDMVPSSQRERSYSSQLPSSFKSIIKPTVVRKEYRENQPDNAPIEHQCKDGDVKNQPEEDVPLEPPVNVVKDVDRDNRPVDVPIERPVKDKDKENESDNVLIERQVKDGDTKENQSDNAPIENLVRDEDNVSETGDLPVEHPFKDKDKMDNSDEAPIVHQVKGGDKENQSDDLHIQNPVQDVDMENQQPDDVAIVHRLKDEDKGDETDEQHVRYDDKEYQSDDLRIETPVQDVEEENRPDDLPIENPVKDANKEHLYVPIEHPVNDVDLENQSDDVPLEHSCTDEDKENQKEENQPDDGPIDHLFKDW